ncbi:acyl-CoA desaturase [Maricaulis sp.]|uniref:acyl-CoA desaturase n=1 Tax=Maricaulis sp. TaxID=1486257 RepID=UPI003A948C2B
MISTTRVHATPASDPATGRVRWAPLQSIWTLSMVVIGLAGAALTLSWENLAVFLVTTAVTIGLGHSIGMHRLLIHRSFACPKWLEYVLVYLGVLVGMAGPIGMVRIHDMRDWAQRQAACHDYFAHRRPFLADAWWQMHCKLQLRHPPRVWIEAEVREDPVYRFLESSWMLQQLPWAILFWALGGWDWVIWGIALRIAVSLSGHWLVGHYAHRQGHQGWRVRGASVQGFNIPLAALITFGESWHANHHAFPGSAKLGLEPGQVDPGWIVLLVWRRLGLVWDLRTPESLPARDELQRLPADRRRGGSCPVLAALCHAH